MSAPPARAVDSDAAEEGSSQAVKAQQRLRDFRRGQITRGLGRFDRGVRLCLAADGGQASAIHLGGGSPNMLSPDDMDALFWGAMQGSNRRDEKAGAAEARRIAAEHAENDRIRVQAVEENGRLRQRRRQLVGAQRQGKGQKDRQR